MNLRFSRERERNVFAEWNRIHREMEQQFLERLSLENVERLDRIARYSLMRMYLNDTVSRKLTAQGKVSLAREFRESQREYFADRLSEFAADAVSAHRENFGTNVASRLWVDYAASIRAAIRIRYTIFELRLSFALHRRGWAGVDYFVSRACKRIPLCFPRRTVTFYP